MPHGKVQQLAAREHQRWRFKNLQEDGQQPNTMHLRRAEGLPDKQYPVRNKRDVWLVNTKPDLNAHFAVYPEELIRPCILAGCPKGGLSLIRSWVAAQPQEWHGHTAGTSSAMS